MTDLKETPCAVIVDWNGIKKTASFFLLWTATASVLYKYFSVAGKDAVIYPTIIYGLLLLYSFLGFLNAVDSGFFDDIQAPLYNLQISLVLPLYASTCWSKCPDMPGPEELEYVFIIFGMFPIFAYFVSGWVRVELVELSVVSSLIAIMYVGWLSQNFYVMMSGGVFYVAFLERKEDISNAVIAIDAYNVLMVFFVFSTAFSIHILDFNALIEYVTIPAFDSVTFFLPSDMPYQSSTKDPE